MASGMAVRRYFGNVRKLDVSFPFGSVEFGSLCSYQTGL